MSKSVSINSAVDFVNKIGSNKTLILENDIYDLSEIKMEYDKNVFFRDEFDGQELVIRNIENLRIEKKKKKRVLICVSPRYATVLNFHNVNNIYLENIQLGHYPEEGECAGGVLCIKHSKDFLIENCELFGCGTYGIFGSGIENLNVNNSIITKCNQEIVGLIDCTDSKFEKCEFIGNKTHVLMFSHCNNIYFNRCDITDNSYEYYKEFEIIGVTKHCINLRDTSRNIIFSDCNIDALDNLTTNSIENTKLLNCTVNTINSKIIGIND